MKPLLIYILCLLARSSAAETSHIVTPFVINGKVVGSKIQMRDEDIHLRIEGTRTELYGGLFIDGTYFPAKKSTFVPGQGKTLDNFQLYFAPTIGERLFKKLEGRVVEDVVEGKTVGIIEARGQSGVERFIVLVTRNESDLYAMASVTINQPIYFTEEDKNPLKLPLAPRTVPKTSYEDL